jgi:hypothetical protein
MALVSRSPWECLGKNKSSFRHGPGGYFKSKNNFSASAKFGLFCAPNRHAGLQQSAQDKQVLFLIVSFFFGSHQGFVQSSGRLGRNEAVVGGSR